MEESRQLIEIIREEVCQYEDLVSKKLTQLFGELDKTVSELNQDDKNWVEEEILKLIEPNFLYKKIYFNSVLLQFFGKPEYIEEIVRIILGNKRIRPITKYFLAGRLRASMFLNKDLETQTTKYLVWKLFQEACGEYETYLDLGLNEIPKEERNPNLVLVITDQFIKPTHAPTKTALDRCAMIKKTLKKECLLINTAEGLTHEGEIPFLLRSIPGHELEVTYIEEYCNKEYQEWNGVKIPFIQCESNMPNPIGVELLINTVKQLKPLFIVDIGGNSMVANLSKQLVPVIGLSLCFSDIVFTTETYQALGRKIGEEDLDLLKKLDIPETHIVESTFTFSFLPQEKKLTRSQIGFGENEFILVVVGFRLNADVTSEFINMLAPLLNQKVKIAFIGGIKDFDKLVEKHSILKEYAYPLGDQRDVLSIIEHCDLYVNPIRKGGGSSCVEAMSKGIPVVSTYYGDVATNVGDAFCVNDYEEMKTKILKYEYDLDYYKEMSQKALERAAVLQDTNQAFHDVLNVMCQREGITL